MAVQIVMDHTGDTRHQFDAADAQAVAEVEARFMEMTGAGFTAAKRLGGGKERGSDMELVSLRKHRFCRAHDRLMDFHPNAAAAQNRSSPYRAATARFKRLPRSRLPPASLFGVADPFSTPHPRSVQFRPRRTGEHVYRQARLP